MTPPDQPAPASPARFAAAAWRHRNLIIPGVALLLLTTAAGLLLPGGVAWRRSAQMVQLVEARGGHIVMADRASAGWLSTLPGDTGERIIYINFSSTELEPGDIAAISRLQHVETLSLEHTNVSDADLLHIRNMTSLRHLNLDHTRVTGANIMELAHLRNLEELSLARTPFLREVARDAYGPAPDPNDIEALLDRFDQPPRDTKLTTLRAQLPNTRIQAW